MFLLHLKSQRIIDAEMELAFVMMSLKMDGIFKESVGCDGLWGNGRDGFECSLKPP